MHMEDLHRRRINELIELRQERVQSELSDLRPRAMTETQKTKYRELTSRMKVVFERVLTLDYEDRLQFHVETLNLLNRRVSSGGDDPATRLQEIENVIAAREAVFTQVFIEPPEDIPEQDIVDKPWCCLLQ